MSTDLAMFDPSKIVDNIKDKIRLEILGVIPPEAWKKMIERAVKDFTAPRPGNYNSNGPLPSRLEEMIHNEIREQFKKDVTDVLNSESFKMTWDSKNGGKYQPSELVKQIAIEAAPAILSQMVSNIVQTAVQHALSAVR